MSTPSIWVAGAGVVSAAGTGMPALEAALADPQWDAVLGLDCPDAPALPVAVCPEFSTRGVLAPLVARRMDRPARLLAVVAHEALAPLGDELPWARNRVAITAGTWNAGTAALVDVLRAVFLTSPEEAPPAQFPSTVSNAPASQLGILHRLGGPNLTFAEKQAGGLRACLEAARLLRHDRADAALACGVDEGDWMHAEGYQRLGTLAVPPSQAGMRLGEGAAVLLLTTRQPETPLARLAGWGAAGTPCLPWRYPATPDAVVAACRQALATAGLEPADVELVLSAGNGIPALAELECAALGAVLGAHRPAVLSINERLGDGAFASTGRVVIAARVLCGQCTPSWPPAPRLASAGFPALGGKRPRVALVHAIAAGGSAVAAVLTSS